MILNFSDRLKWLYKKAHEQTGKPVVILIDEYDSPMLEVMHDPKKLIDFRNLFRSFYSPYDYMQEKEKSYHLIFLPDSSPTLPVCRFGGEELRRSQRYGAEDTNPHLRLQIDEKGYLIPYECDRRQVQHSARQPKRAIYRIALSYLS